MFKSWVMVNGDDVPGLEKAMSSGADAVIINLYKRPDSACLCAAGFILAQKGVAKAPTLFVRISPVALEASIDQMEVVMKSAPFGIALAECESGIDVQQLSNRIAVLEAMNGIELGATKIIGFVETAAAVLKMDSYRGASKRLFGLVFNADGLAINMSMESAGGFDAGLNTARSLVLFGAKSAGVLAIDVVRNGGAAKRNGFDGVLVFG